MPISLKMPALSPTMEEGTLAKWIVKEGDTVSSGDLLAEIETDKATMEFEAIDEGIVAKIVIPEGTDGVKVGEVIAILAEEGEDVADAVQSAGKGNDTEQQDTENKKEKDSEEGDTTAKDTVKSGDDNIAGEDKATANAPAPSNSSDRIKASPLARRMAEQKGVDLASVKGSGPGGRVVKADVENANSTPKKSDSQSASETAVPVAKPSSFETDIPHEAEKLSNMRKTIARRLTEAKQSIPHIYLTVDIRSMRC